MNSKQLETLITESFQGKMQPDSCLRITASYEQLLQLQELCIETASHPEMETGNETNKFKVRYQALLRSMYTQCGLFLERFFSEIVSYDVKFNSFLTNVPMPNPIATDVLTPVYKISTYRNKIVESPFVSVEFVLHKEKENEWRLKPARALPNEKFREKDQSTIKDLAFRNKAIEEKIGKEKNLASLVELLFESMPYIAEPEFQRATPPSKDRQTLASLIQHYGSSSRTPKELIDDVSLFVAAVCNAYRQ